jgi:hypothetical protein
MEVKEEAIKEELQIAETSAEVAVDPVDQDAPPERNAERGEGDEGPTTGITEAITLAEELLDKLKSIEGGADFVEGSERDEPSELTQLMEEAEAAAEDAFEELTDNEIIEQANHDMTADVAEEQGGAGHALALFSSEVMPAMTEISVAIGSLMSGADNFVTTVNETIVNVLDPEAPVEYDVYLGPTGRPAAVGFSIDGMSFLIDEFSVMVVPSYTPSLVMQKFPKLSLSTEGNS